MTEHEQTGIVTSVGSLGVDHAASFDRSYWNRPVLYEDPIDLQHDWHSFLAESLRLGRRRAMFRTMVAPDVMAEIRGRLPVEAALPVEENFLTYIGANAHLQTAIRAELLGVQPRELVLPAGYILDFATQDTDAGQLFSLWGQFGWTREGVENMITAGTTPIVIIRDIEERAIATMIAESLEFGDQILVELTEMAVADSEKGHGLASVLIRELARHTQNYFGGSPITYGEYNMTTGAHRSAMRAGQLPANSFSDGVLRDHVSIETGPGNVVSESSWSTRWLHDFMVLYQGSE
ncbi:MAG: hypothetical protein GW947_00945 [Candidatus Pacebacteria bacterium]|nr:hypothetical protein [Candidatus Paceibacterota bacterium]PIR60117.1 MAG: hypothetical protein COU68_03070 [Candidatus Pacebacteria bacterium CG10_big_fil_rev_8_21_14_0_10_45_6]